MAIYKHLRSSTANKRPTTSIADGQLAINTNTASPGLFFKDSAGTGIVKVGPVHVGTTAPNVSPAAGGSSGNYTGEQWLDTSVSPNQMKVWNGSAWVGIVADELPVSKLQDGTAGQIVQTDSAGTGVEWSSTTNLPIGSAGAPAYSFQSDSNTGIYSPGPDQVAISTGGAVSATFNGSSGSLAQGAITYTATTFALVGGGAAEELTVTKNGVDVASFGVDGGGPRITSGGAFRFETNNFERLRITSDGKVGIGASSPSELLHLASSASPAIRIRNTAAGVGAFSQLQLDTANSYNNGSVVLKGISENAGNNSVSFAVETSAVAGSPVEKFRITSDGKVGIGTSSPSYVLDVSSGAGNGIHYQNTVNSIGAVLGASSSSAHVGSTTSHPVEFLVGSVERARIDSSGRLLVGTSTARDKFFNTTYTPQLQLEGVGQQQSFFSLTNSVADNGGPVIGLAKQRSGSVGGNTIVNNGDTVGQLVYFGSDGTEMISLAEIVGQVDGTPGANDMPGRLVFSTTADGASSPTERMRIDSSGAFKTSANGTYKHPGGVTEITHNDTSSSIQLVASNTSFAGDAVTISTYRNTVNDSYRFFTCVRQGFAVALEIRDDGDVYNVNGTYGSLSDAKLKENIVDAQSQWDDIKRLRVRNYNFKPETNNSTHKQIGVIAQEIEGVSPGLVNTVSDRDVEGNDLGTVTKSVNYSVLYMKAVKALQEAMERIETLEAKVAALESA